MQKSAVKIWGRGGAKDKVRLELDKWATNDKHLAKIITELWKKCNNEKFKGWAII